MSTLTLPGTISGLLRRGSPVLAPVSLRVRAVGRRALVEGEHLDTGMVALADGAMEAPADVHLDLTDATGRAHAAWWLADKLYRKDGPHIAASVLPGQTFGPMRFGLSTISVDHGERWRAFDEMGTNDLDPNDPRLLPDGSRWVDAEALRRVVLHVAGVAS